MNQRYEQLLAQAHIVPNPPGTYRRYDNILPEQMGKFAELIVKECIDKITTYDLVPGHSAKWEDIYDIHARLLQDLGEELKEHFGVEE